MTFEEQVADALPTHSEDCAIYGGVNPEGPCDCDRTERLAARVAAAIEAAVPNGSRLDTARERALAALRGEA